MVEVLGKYIQTNMHKPESLLDNVARYKVGQVILDHITNCNKIEYNLLLPILVYDSKQSDGEVPAMLELWGMRSTPSLPLLSGPLWPGVVAPDKGPIYGLNRTKPCFFHYTDFCI